MPEEANRPLTHHQIRREEDPKVVRETFHSRNLEVDEVDDKVQLTTFKVGLKSREFMVSLAKNPPKTMTEKTTIKDVEKNPPEGTTLKKP